MPRTLRPLNPRAGPAQAFAAELRELYEEAGSPKFLQMARRTGKSRTALSEAVGGDHLPTWETVAAFVTACGSDPMLWRNRWEKTRDDLQGKPNQDPVNGGQEVEAAEPESIQEAVAGPTFLTVRRQLLRFLPYVVAIIVSSAMTSVVTAAVIAQSGNDPPRQAATADLIVNSAVITVQNKVALGDKGLVEDATPAYLSSEPTPFCASYGCKVAGTEVGSGALLVAVCYVHGEEMFNYNLDAAESRSNPHRPASSLWYKVMFPGGESGYIAEVYIEPADRGGEGLPVCE